MKHCWLDCWLEAHRQTMPVLTYLERTAVMLERDGLPDNASLLRNVMAGDASIEFIQNDIVARLSDDEAVRLALQYDCVQWYDCDTQTICNS